MENPIWQEFLTAQPTAPFALNFDPKDPALDQDPYFLRSQTWKKTSAATELIDGYDFRKIDGNKMELRIPGTARALVLNAPLTPFQATEDFIFFSADDAKIFRDAAGRDDYIGEGLFFISTEDLAARAIDHQPVPFYHFPLPDRGWTGHIDSMEFPQIDTLVVANENGETIPLSLRDVETLMKAQRTNLMLATAVTVKFSKEPLKAFQNLQSLTPAPGTTAAFGMIFTGLNLENPSQSLWTPASDSFVFRSVLKNLVKRYPLFKSDEARAVMNPELVKRIIFVSIIINTTIAASTYIRYRDPAIRTRFDKENKVNPPTSIGARAFRSVRQISDIFAHLTTTYVQLNTVTTSNSIEIFLDKFAPAVAASDHTVLRRFLNNTFYYARNTVTQAPVNGKTFLLGSIVMGGVDTAFVVVQYTGAVPLICESIAPYLGGSFQDRVIAAFDPHNPDFKNLVLQDSVRNALVYLQSGASSYSMETKQQIMDQVEKETDQQMRSRGQDPRSPQNQSIRDKLIAKKVDLLMRQRGLPSSDQFLFDYTTLFQDIPHFLGYKAVQNKDLDSEFIIRQEEQTREEQVKTSFILAKRFGLAGNALERALQTAKAQLGADPGDETARQVVAILEETNAKMSFLRNGAFRGEKGLKEARRVRSILTVLSYEGPVDLAVKYIPKLWSEKYSPEAAQGASLMFRRALFSYLAKEGELWLMPDKKSIELYAGQAKQRALGKMARTYPELQNLAGDDLERAIQRSYAYQMKMQTQLEIVQLARETELKRAAESYTPPKHDWLTRRQERKAARFATEQLLVEQARLSEPMSQSELETRKAAYFQKWKQEFTRSMASQVGLRLRSGVALDSEEEAKYRNMISFIEKTAAETTQGHIENHPGLMAYLAKLLPDERLRYEAGLYAATFLNTYKTAATEFEMVSPRSPYQPGAFQRLRQTTFIQKNGVLNGALRWAESLGNDQALEPGLYAKLSRMIPLFNDLVQAHKRMLRSGLTSLTTGYLWSYYALQVHLPYTTFVLFVATAASTIAVPSQWLSRAFRMNGIRAMDDVWSKMQHGFYYTWVTFLGMIPLALYQTDFNRFFADHVRDPFVGFLNMIPADMILAGGAAAAAAPFVARGAVRVARAMGFDAQVKTQSILSEIATPRRGFACQALFH